ncbi:response regulator [Candidatus Binatia bacterium]|nr:response regulator [Candidatus Binatia bacterium]
MSTAALIWCFVSAAALLGVAVIARAERRRRIVAEERYRGLFDHAVEGMFLTTPDGRYIDVNPTLAKLYGFASRDHLIRCFSDIANELYVDPSRRGDFVAAMERDGVVVGFESEIRRADGARIWISENARAVRDGDGSIVRFEGTVVDVTARREAETALLRAKEAAEAAAHLKSDFLATMSHELRTPMNGVLGMTSLLLETPLSDDQRELASTVYSSADSLLEILNDILDLSKIEAGRLELEEIDFDPRQLAENVVELLAEPAQRKGLELAYAVDAAVPSLVRGDPGRVRQVLMNLAGNAVKFTERGEVVLRVALASRDAEHVTLRFTVADTGIGIDPAHRRALFEPFTQADASMSRRYGGTGLGLTICRRITELLDGDIGLDSQPGQGSTFWFTARLAAAELCEDADVSLQPCGRLVGRHVLLLSDHTATEGVLRHLLWCWRARVEAYDDVIGARAALARAARAQTPYDVLIADASLRNAAGGDLLEQLGRSRITGARRVVLLAPLGEISRHRSAPGVHVLAKPLRPARLLAAIEAPGVERAAPVDTRRDLELALEAATDVASSTAALVSTVVEAGGPPTAHVADGTPRILVVEDNLVNQRLAVRIVERLGCRASVARNGREGVEQFLREPVDLVLMDCQMPEMNGFDATRAIRAAEQQDAHGGDASHVPIVAVTANAGTREECLASGMDEYLTKPLRVDDLRAVIDRLLARRRTTCAAPDVRADGQRDVA